MRHTRDLRELNAAVTVMNAVAAVEMPFTVSPTEYTGSGPITPSNAKLARPDASEIAPVSLVPGQIFVRTVNPLPDRTVQFFPPSQDGTNYVIQATTDFLTGPTSRRTPPLASFWTSSMPTL